MRQCHQRRPKAPEKGRSCIMNPMMWHWSSIVVPSLLAAQQSQLPADREAPKPRTPERIRVGCAVQKPYQGPARQWFWKEALGQTGRVGRKPDCYGRPQESPFAVRAVHPVPMRNSSPPAQMRRLIGTLTRIHSRSKRTPQSAARLPPHLPVLTPQPFSLYRHTSWWLSLTMATCSGSCTPLTAW